VISQSLNFDKENEMLVKKISKVVISTIFVAFVCSYSVFAYNVNTNISCNAGSVTASAYAIPNSPFGQISMDLSIQGPDYNSYLSGSGTSYVYLTGGAGFQYDSYYTATACAYFDDDDGGYVACDTRTCVTPIEPTTRGKKPR
jgi:hypothetical protein